MSEYKPITPPKVRHFHDKQPRETAHIQAC